MPKSLYSENQRINCMIVSGVVFGSDTVIEHQQVLEQLMVMGVDTDVGE